MIDVKEVSKALIPHIAPILNYDDSSYITIRANQNRDKPTNHATVFVRRLYQVGRADKGQMDPTNGREYQSTWITEIDLRTFGASAGLRMNHLRSSLNFQTLIDALAGAGIGLLSYSEPIDQSTTQDTEYEERSFMTLTCSLRDGDLTHDPSNAVTLSGALGTPVLNPDEVPIAKISIDSCIADALEGEIVHESTTTITEP